MDKTNGKLYLIKYWEDHTEASTYAIESSELLNEQHFIELIENYNNKIPEIKLTYGDFYNRNWNEFLNVNPIQVVKAFYLAISFSKDGKKNLLHFIGDRPLPICYSCSIEEYDSWKTKHGCTLDDLIYLNELMGNKFYSAKKALGFSLKKTQNFRAFRDEIFKQSDIANANGGNMEIIFVKNGLLQYKKNTSNESIENAVLEISNLLEYKNN